MNKKEKSENDMKLIIVRHGEPNYEIDGLTEKGKVEAELVSRKLTKENISEIYCSVLGRARLTAEPTLKKLGMTAEYCEWLKEFDYKVSLPYLDKEDCAWDLLPSFAAEQRMAVAPFFAVPLSGVRVTATGVPARLPSGVAIRFFPPGTGWG